MAREEGIEKISTCKKAVHFSLFSTLALGCLFCLQKVLSSMKRPIGKYTGMLPEVLACLFCVFVFVCLSACLHLCLCVCAHCATRCCSLVASASAFRNGILHAFAILSLLFLSNKWQTALIKKKVNLL